MLLAAITYYPLYLWLGRSRSPATSTINRGLHHLHPRLLRRDGLWIGRGVPGGILPRQDRYVGVGAVSHRQRLGRRLVPFITSAAFAATASVTPDLPDRSSAVCFIIVFS
jgi:hypothetical protein